VSFDLRDKIQCWRNLAQNGHNSDSCCQETCVTNVRDEIIVLGIPELVKSCSLESMSFSCGWYYFPRFLRVLNEAIMVAEAFCEGGAVHQRSILHLR
jgi:hypothetical protein